MHIFAMEGFFMVMIYGQGTFDNYRAALAAVGLETEVSTDTAVARRCEGLLLPGGGDIFGGLDRRETAVINAFVARRRPVLGTCRGMQALNVYFGGTLHDQITGHQLAAGDMVHPTRAEGLPAELLGDAPYVTSNHHQAVNALGRGLSDCQWGSDGVIEAVVHTSLPVLGVQYHPERQSFSRRREDAVDAAPLFHWWAAQIK